MEFVKRNELLRSDCEVVVELAISSVDEEASHSKGDHILGLLRLSVGL